MITNECINETFSWPLSFEYALQELSNRVAFAINNTVYVSQKSVFPQKDIE
jgi:hypothetical protein